jgi:hypothetical protein
MAVNTIIKLCLETRAKELRESGKSLDDIALILSKEAKQKITKSALFRYFESNTLIAAQVAEKQEQLKAKVLEAEISTINDRQTVIEGLLKIAEESDNERNRIMAYKTATEALDCLDKRLGKLSSGNNGLTINNINAVKLEEIPTDQLLKMVNISRLGLNASRN